MVNPQGVDRRDAKQVTFSARRNRRAFVVDSMLTCV